MVTVSLLSTFGLQVMDGLLHITVGGSWFDIHTQDLLTFLGGHVVGRNDTGTVCLTKNRLVLTDGPACAILLFPPALLDEFVEQLDNTQGDE